MISIKKIYLLLFFSSLFLSLNCMAGQRYWRGNGSNKNWNSTGNWSSTLTGATGSAVPGVSDTVYFDSTGVGQCIINATVSIRRLSITAYYTDTIKQGSNSFTIGSGGAVLSGGTFLGGTSSITNTGIFTLSGCQFISTSASLSITGNYTFSSGTFTHNNGTVVFTTSGISITGNTTFYNLTFSPGGSGTFTISSGTLLTCNHLLRTAGIAGIRLNTGNIDAKGDIQIDNTYSATASVYGGTATITINGTTKQILTGAATIGQGVLCNITINKASDTLVLKNYISVAGDWTYTQGILDASTFSSTVVFASGTKTISGTHSLYNIALYGTIGSSVNDIISSDTLTVNGNITTNGTNPVSVNNGTILSKGNITINNINNASTTHGGTGTLLISGAAKQILTGASTFGYGRLCNVKIKKTGDTLILKNNVNVSGDWTYVSGIIDAQTFSSTVCFTYDLGRTISGKHSLYNVTFYGSSSNVSTIGATDTLTVNGTLTTAGSGLITINTGIISVRGNMELNNTSVNATVGTGTFYICGNGDQTIDGTGTTLTGRICGVKINKSTGTLYLKDFITLGDNAGWELVSTSTIPNVTTYSSTVNFCRGTRAIKGKLTFDNLTFNGTSIATTNNFNSGDTVTVNNELRIEGSHGVTLNTGIIKVLKDVTITNTVTAVGGGSATLYICGTGAQNFTGSGIVLGGCLPNVKIDKSNDTLYLSSIISLGSGAAWTYIQGDVSPGTSTVVVLAGGTVDCDNGAEHMEFNNFTVQGGGTESLAGVLRVLGTFKIDAARTLNTNSYAMEIGGNWNVLGTLTYGTSQVTFNGSGNQYILAPTGTASLYNMVVNKPSGKFYLNAANLNVTNSLTLTKGIVVSTATDILQLTNNSTLTGGSDSSYVHGPVKKTGDDVFTFPLGDTVHATGAYHPLAITAPSVSTDAFTAQYFGSSNSNYSGATDTTVTSVSSCEYWNLARTTGTSTVSVTLGWNSNSCSIISAPNARIVYWNTGTSKWLDKGGTSSTGTVTAGTVTTSAAQSSFGDFSLAITKDVLKHFRSKTTGSWESTGTWEMSADSVTWTSSTATPYYNSSSVNVQALTTVTINGNLNIDQTTVNGSLIYGNTAGSTLSINNGSGIDLTVNGVFGDRGPNAIAWDTSSTWICGAAGTFGRTTAASGDGWRDHYSGGISTIPASATWIIRKTGADDPSLISTGGMYYPNLNIENTSGSTWTTTGSSCFTGSSEVPVIKGNFYVGGTGTSPVVFANNNTNSSPILVQGSLITKAGSTLQNNGTGFELQGDLTNNGSITGTPVFTFSGSAPQNVTGTGISGIKVLTINKGLDNVLLGTSFSVDSALNLTHGAFYMTSSSNVLTVNNSSVVNGGSDSSYVSGTLKKVGNTSFTFPLGDVSLLTGAYHPLSITAPANVTDAFSAQYFATGQVNGSTLQADSIETISDCEYWLLTRNSGTSVVVPSLGWNLNSCNIDNYEHLRLSGWDGSQWKLLGNSAVDINGASGNLHGTVGLNYSPLPLLIANSSVEILNTTTPVTDAGSNQSICPGTSAELEATGADKYSWYPETGLSNVSIANPIAAPDTTTKYYVIGSNGNIDVIDSVTITVRTPPSLSVSDTNNIICQGGSVLLSATGTGTFLWQPSYGLTDSTSSSPTASPDSTICYIVTLTDIYSCNSKLVVTVKVPEILLSVSDTVMVDRGDSIRLYATLNSGVLNWTPYTSVSDSTLEAPFALTDTSLVYTVTATADTCSTPANVLVMVNNEPMAGFAFSFPGLTVNFATNNIGLAVYAWDFGDSSTSTLSTPSHTYSSAGTYNVCLTVTNIRGTSKHCQIIEVE
jgi:hypothetical protein